MVYLFSILTSFILGVAIFPVFIRLLHELKLKDSPGGRKLHTRSTPTMGGILIFFSAFLSTLVWEPILEEGRFIWTGIVLLLILGLRDDFAAISAKAKLGVQILVVALVVNFADIRIENFHGFLGIGELPYGASVLFSGFVILVFINAFNLIDGMDGLAGTYAIFVSVFIIMFFIGLNDYRFNTLSLALIGSLVAFLAFNWRPAKVFMGDTGSLPLGFILGVFLVELISSDGLDRVLEIKAGFSLGVAIFIFPLLDMARVFFKRIKKGKHPMHPDKTHIHHFLLRMGFNPPQIIGIILIFNLLCIVLVMSLKTFSDHLVLAVLSAFAIFSWFVLESVAKKFVRIHVAGTPRILEKRKQTGPRIKAIERTQDIGSGTMNLN